MAATPICVQNIHKSFLEPVGRFPTWYVVLGTRDHYNFFKCLPWVNLDLFHGKGKFGSLGFSIRKSENIYFSETIAACDLKVGRLRQLIE